MSIQIMQGDQYALLFSGTADGEPLDMSRIERIEFIVGRLRKCWPDEVGMDESGNFLFPLSQEETLAMMDAPTPVQIRVKMNEDGAPVVIGTDIGTVEIVRSRSKAVL